jgi:glutathione synthase/RimK-type ligase-like ATP-grasp enzyme
VIDVLLATSTEHKDGEPGHEALDEAFASRGLTSRWAVWDDPFVDWSEARLVCVRSTWDYDRRLPDFLGWAQGVGPTLLHGVEAFRWNTDKSYLTELASLSSVPTVPSVIADNPVDLRAAISRFGTSVVKPRVGAGGRGIVIVYDAESWLPVDTGPWIVQPLLESVQREGEVSVFVIGGHPVSQVNKKASRDDIRVHPEYGGTSEAVTLTHEAALLAVDAVAATTEILGAEIVYARVDMLRSDGKLLVSEVEITEPGLYLDLVPENAEKFVEAVTARL